MEKFLSATDENMMENINHFRIKTGRLFLKYYVLLDSELQFYEFEI